MTVLRNVPPIDDMDLPCRTDPERMFPGGKTPETRARMVARAKTVCEPCAFKDPCLSYALVNDVVGVWGATDEDERADMRRKHGIVPAPIDVAPDRRTFRKDRPAYADEVWRLTELGYSAALVAERLRISERSVQRVRAEMQAAS